MNEPPEKPLPEAQREAGAVEVSARLPSRGLLDRDWQKLLVVFLTLLSGLALLWVAWIIVSPILRILVLFGLGGVLAFALARPVNALAVQVGNRVAAIFVVYVVVGAIAVGGIALLAGPFAGQATELTNNLPAYADDLQRQAPGIESWLGQYGLQADLDSLKAQAVTAVEQGGADVLKNLVSTAAEVGGALLDTVLILVISFYWLVDGPRFRARALALVPTRHRGKALFFEDNVSRVLGGYLRGQLTLALIVGLATGIGMQVLGLPYAVVLGVLAGLFEMVPMFGPILSAVPAVIVALFMPFPTVIWVLVFFLVVQQVENNVLAPRISGHAVGLHPLGALFALLVGFQLAGVLGGLFAVPIAGVLWVLVTAAYHHSVAAEQPPRRRWTIPRLRRASPTVPPADHAA